MTLVDLADLHERTCRHCGLIVGNMLTHKRWHDAQDEAFDAIRETLRPLARDLERRATEST